MRVRFMPRELRRSLSSVALVVLAAAPAFSRAAATGSTLEAALATVSADHIKSDIFFLASDEMGGRDTPSTGQRIAARYIRARLERLRFEPGAPNGYFYEYPLFQPRIDEQGTHVTFVRGEEEHELAFGSDYFFTARRATTSEVEAGIVFCARGTEHDFDPSVTGQWALVLDGGQSTLAIEKRAREAGVAGLVFVPAATFDGKDYAKRFEHDVTAARRAGVRWPQRSDSKDKDGERDPAILYLTRAAAQRAFPIDALENQIDASPRPAVEGRLRDTRKLQGGGDGTIQLENVCGFWRGGDPELSKEVIVVSAHYDHVGTDSTGVVYNGADDNGSGTSGLLALAEALATRGPLRRSVMLMWVSGEEKGLWGSRAWTEKPWLPEGCKAVCDINIDMIGRNAPDYLLITPTAGRPEYNGLVKLAEANCALEGFPKLGSCDSYWDRSDHRNFAVNLKLPVTFLFSDVHEDYHQPGDDPEKIDCDKIRRVVRLVLRMLEGLQKDRLDL